MNDVQISDGPMLAVDAVWGGHPHENPGRRPKNRASGLGCVIRMKTPGTVPTTGTSGLAVASTPSGSGRGSDPTVTLLSRHHCFQSPTMSYARKKKITAQRMFMANSFGDAMNITTKIKPHG